MRKFQPTTFDIGGSTFNKIFWNSPNHILKRFCPDCEDSHREIYYKRLTKLDSFDLYSYTEHWRSEDNILGQDFKLYSTLDDAMNDRNAWTYCNYDDNTGMFRDCGPNGAINYQWTGPQNGGKRSAFYLMTDEYSYVGCFGDDDSRTIDYVVSGGDKTIDECHAGCHEYKYFGLQYGQGTGKGECRCGNSRDEATRLGVVDRCDNTGTGGPWANAVYENLGTWAEPIFI